jgi:protein TonB
MVPQSVPQPFAAIARRCLRTDPARRGTVEAMQLRLAPAKASTEQEVKAASRHPTNRRMGPLVAVAAVVLVVIGIWIALAHREQPTAPPQQAQAQPANAPAQASAQLPPSQANPAAAEPPAATQPTASNATEAPPAQAPAATIPPATATPPPAQTQGDETPAPAAAINPAIMSQILPDILPSAMKTINGTLRVSVELTVGADGNVTDATLASPGPSKYFAGKSLEAARHWKFRPTQAGNWTLEFQYTRGGIHVVAGPSAP